MKPLRHIVEPTHLLMTWQPSDSTGHSRLRRVVAEVEPDSTDRQLWHFRYRTGTSDMLGAEAAGFQGHPAFQLNRDDYVKEVRETLMKRLPPRSREDFALFLQSHRLPNPFPASDLALLGYTGAKLPSDGFAFVPRFGEAAPCEYILEVAGVRHVYDGSLNDVKVGDSVQFLAEPTNSYDSDAIAILHCGRKLGYVNRAMLADFHHWLRHDDLEGFVERLNGTEERPLVYVRVRVGCSNEVV